MNTILECKNLAKTYGTHCALSELNLTLERGQIVGLLGPNGSGKTTLIKLINGLLTPNEGEVLINGSKPSVDTKKIVSYLPDQTYLDDWMTVNETIDYFAEFYSDFQKERAYDMLKALQINPKQRFKSFSKGTKEKVQLILVMSRDAELYVLDEPIGGVDPAARDYIIQTILTNYNENATVLISTHLIAEIENVLDRVVFLKEGHLVINTTVDELRMEKRQSVDEVFREVFKC